MARTISLEIITPEKVVLKSEVEFFSVRAAEGDVGILPGHAPLFTALQLSVLKYVQGGTPTYMAVMGGFLEVANDHATVLCDAAEHAEAIDELRAKQAKARAEIDLAEKKEHVAITDVSAALQRALLRLRVAELSEIRRKHPR